MKFVSECVGQNKEKWITMKKKVLHILGGVGFGGAEAFAMNQFRNLQNEFIFDFAVQVKYGPNQSYEKEIHALGGEIYYTGLFRDSPIAFSQNISKIIKEHGPYCAVHIHINEQCGFAAIGAKKAGVKSVIVHAHSSQYDQHNLFVKTAMLLLNKFLVRIYADIIVACSDEAAKMYFGKQNAIVFKNPIDIKRYYNAGSIEECRNTLGVKSKLVISHIGRFIDVKNHDFILKICKKLSDDKINYSMLLIGNGELRNEIEKKVDMLGLKNKVFFLGERSDIPQILRASSIMILPSKYEGLPTVVLEAQASGIPCIISTHVNRMCDVGLGLVEFLDIDKDDSVLEWACALREKKNNVQNIECIEKAFSIHGISLNDVSEKLKHLYC